MSKKHKNDKENDNGDGKLSPRSMRRKWNDSKQNSVRFRLG